MTEEIHARKFAVTEIILYVRVLVTPGILRAVLGALRQAVPRLEYQIEIMALSGEHGIDAIPAARFRHTAPVGLVTDAESRHAIGATK